MSRSSCNLCSSEDFQLIRPYPGWEGYDLVLCARCALMQIRPVPSDEFLLNFYNSSFGKDPLMGFDMSSTSEKGFRLRATLQLDFVRKMIGDGALNDGKGKRILDVGCHAASFLSLFKARGWEVTGVDPNPRSSYGEKWYGIKVIRQLFSKGMFPAGSFDAILHSHALEHVPDPRGNFEEFHRILKPGGWAFIEVPNESYEKVSVQKTVPHLYFFTPETLSEMARNAGFEVRSTRVLGIPRLARPLFSQEGCDWLALRWKARFDAAARPNLLTSMPFFGKIFKEDRYFAGPEPRAEMLRVFLAKGAGLQNERPRAPASSLQGTRDA